MTIGDQRVITTNETLTSTMDIIKAIARSAEVKGHRGFSDFLADKIIQATTQPTLMASIEKLATLLQTQMVYGTHLKLVNFLNNATSVDADVVLNWLREYPRVAAMIVVQKEEIDYENCLASIEIDKGKESEKGTAISIPDYNVRLDITCLSPLAHGADQKAGNATLFRRMQVLSTTGQVLNLPFYAGNALRGQMRDCLADHFLKMVGLSPSKSNPPCKLWFFHALYAGGALEENSKQAKTMGKLMGANGAAKAAGIHEFRNMLPPLSLLGTALGNRVMSGRVAVGDCRPECQEWGFDSDIKAASLSEWTFLTRREDHESHEDGNNSSMIANTECLKAGTKLHGGLDVSLHATDIEKSCLATGLYLLKKDGYIGAERRRGLGRVNIQISSDIPVFDSSLYEKYLVENKESIINYLLKLEAVDASCQFDSISYPF